MSKLWLAVIASTAVGCGESDGISIDNLLASIQDASCEQAVRCQEQPDEATCKATTFMNDTTSLTIVAGVKGGTIKYDSSQAQDCVDSIRDGSCAFSGFHPIDSPCDGMLSGTVAVGGACQLSSECAGDAVCAQTDQNCNSDTMCCAGTCTAPDPEVASGGVCGDATGPCADGTYCSYTSQTAGTCKPYITTAGTACDSLDACAGTMLCDIFANSPTCFQPAPSGGTCDPDVLLPCADFREHCDASMKCVAAVAAGGACEFSGDCRQDHSCVGGTCQADVGVGGSCPDDGVGCLGDLDCPASMTCTAPTAGMTCL
jgi:hypothetical protein